MNQNIGNNYTSFQKLRLAMLAAMMLLIIGTAGFVWFEEMTVLDALYMTVITVSTVGFGEVVPLHPGGRAFVILLIVFGVGLAYFLASAIGQAVIEGQFREVLGRRKMENKIKKMKDHFVIAGFGRVGQQVAEEFKKKSVPFLVIEKDSAATMKMYNEGIYFVQGEATDDDILRQARLENAKVLISTLPDAAQNVYLTLTARDMCPELKIIARADYEDAEKKLKRAGANHVVSPHTLGGTRMALASIRPNVLDFMHTTALGDGGLTIEEFIIPAACKLVNKSIKDSGIKQDYGATIIGIKKPGEDLIITPQPDVILGADDVLVLVGHADDLERLSDSMN